MALAGICGLPTWAQPNDDFHSILEGYIAASMQSNLALRSESLEVEKAVHALAEARARFYPAVSLEARYSRADGGRVIDLPFGTVLNPVYSTLNDMLIADGQAARFPPVADETVDFLRREEQDTRIVVRQPLYAPAIAAAVRAQSALLDAGNYRRMAIARTLRRDVTLAYIDWLRARDAVAIVAASEAVLRENLRVNQALFDNSKVTEDRVLRARAELLDVEQQHREMTQRVTQAQSYFNFLLNRDLLTPIVAATAPDVATPHEAALEQLWSQALSRRPEIAQLAQLKAAREHQVTLARKQHWPTLSLSLDAGTQSENYRFGDGYNFGVASLLFTWKIFDGGADRARVHQARAAERQVVLHQEEVAQQIRLEVQQALDRLRSARDSLQTAAARVEAARAAFRIASRKRDEGVASQVEFIDARSTLTRAELNYNVTHFEVLARRAELDYATSTGDLPLEPGP